MRVKRYGLTSTIASKSLTYLGLAIAIVAIYSAIVVGPVMIIGRWDAGDPGLLLPIVASAVVAVLFEPIRSRLERLANCVVCANRVSPYEVLSQVTSSLTDVAAEDGTSDLAQLLARGTGAERAIVWVAGGGMLHPSAVSPDTARSGIVPVTIDGVRHDEVSESRLVIHHGELFGALTIIKPRNDPVTPADRQLLSDVAAASGLLLRNVSLNSELEQHAADVRGSRRRLIAARDAERLRLERDLHDGAQQQVVALKVKLGIARTIAQREGADEIASLLTSLARDTQQAVDALRAVAHGTNCSGLADDVDEHVRVECDGAVFAGERLDGFAGGFFDRGQPRKTDGYLRRSCTACPGPEMVPALVLERAVHFAGS